MNITVVGAGYVGLVTSACFAEMGNTVTCTDADTHIIDALNTGVIPVYEPGLEALVRDNVRAGRLRFSARLGESLQDSSLCFITLPTPSDADGAANLQPLLALARAIGEQITQPLIVVNKSTVPVGTAERVAEVIHQALAQRSADIAFEVVSNPEFLKEGSAVDDFMRPDRIIVGVDSAFARSRMSDLYQSFSRQHDKLMFMGVRDAELTKYAASAMLATRISLMNEMANLAERMGVDIEHVRRGIGSDSRIGYSFIYPGCGYGGSSFPQDIKTLMRMSEASGFTPGILQAVEERNALQKQRLFEKLVLRLGENMEGRTVGVWGLAFKPGTDDMRDASSVELINRLIGAGACVRAYDPVAMETARRYFPSQWVESGRLVFCEHQYDALAGADAMVLVTEWKPFRQPDFNAIRKLLKQPVIIDGRNQYDPYALKAQGFDYAGIGRDLG